MGCRPRARSVLQCRGVLPFRKRLLELRCGAVWEHGSCTLELVSCRFRRQRQGPWTRADGRKKQGLKLVSRQLPIRPSVPWCFAVSEAPARSSLWSCFEGLGAALVVSESAATGSSIRYGPRTFPLVCLAKATGAIFMLLSNAAIRFCCSTVVLHVGQACK